MNSPDASDAGRRAAAELRWADAFESLARVDATVGLPPHDLETLSTAALLRGEPTAAVDARSRAFDAYLSEGDASGAWRCAGWIALNSIELGDFSQSLAWAAKGMRVADMAGASMSEAGVVRLAPALAQLVSGDPASAVPKLREALDLADRIGNHDLGAAAALALGKCVIQVDGPAAAFPAYDRAMASVAAGTVAPDFAGVIASAVIGDAFMAFDLDRAVTWIGTFERWCGAQPQLLTFTGELHAHRSALLQLRGDWAQASAAAELAMARHRAGDFRAVYGAPYQFAELARLRGAFHSAEESYRRAGASGWAPQPGRALLHVAMGRIAEAQVEIRRDSASADPFIRRFLLPSVVEVEAAAGDAAAARRAAEEFRAGAASAGAMDTTMDAAVAATADARAHLAGGALDDALAAGRAAIEAWTGIGAPYERARARVVVGRTLVALGDAPAADEEFAAARAAFLALDAEPDLAALAELADPGRGGVLTAREVEVLRLVSTGLTNRGIAERLTLSEKTVARHLSNIFGKLGLASRAAATAYAYEHGLV
ncbi:response regulator transcription factor [Agromyces sp. ZXT2-6]|uniref:response regulator transcription factor n=1 Tax=Agromyces sp. ZXT2-6 TaxID=3461153 RepID=UPI004054F4D3